MDYFDISKYLLDIKNKNTLDVKDKLGNNIIVGDEIYVKDHSNYHKNVILGTVTKCFIRNNKPIIRIDRDCSNYENKYFEFSTKKKCNDEQLSFMCLKYLDFENINLD